MLVVAGVGAVIYYALTKAKNSRNELEKPRKMNYLDGTVKSTNPFKFIKKAKHKINGELLKSSHFV
jgi:hypothetical protein